MEAEEVNRYCADYLGPLTLLNVSLLCFNPASHCCLAPKISQNAQLRQDEMTAKMATFVYFVTPRRSDPTLFWVNSYITQNTEPREVLGYCDNNPVRACVLKAPQALPGRLWCRVTVVARAPRHQLCSKCSHPPFSVLEPSATTCTATWLYAGCIDPHVTVAARGRQTAPENENVVVICIGYEREQFQIGARLEAVIQ
ncbi:hypothetical protein GWK47_003438 [Chionoecetes opilio]|uniref:Uncharacterized protein n=1 Tax=Chionoecetes opilio TaxID=41210 RepID=A0A8J4YS13_CHIOP|nr:hypothetical protein GWK47_003438 [Chionoecetes opilio]